MKLSAVELRRVQMPLVAPFQTAFGTQTERDVLLVRALTDQGEGWGECVALAEPVYSAEYVDGAEHVLRHHLLPRLFALPDVTAELVSPTLRGVHGHQMAKCAAETALLDAQLRSQGTALGAYLGAVRNRVDCGVAVAVMGSVPRLLDAVEGYLAQGYRRIKLKIAPGWDVEPVAAVRERFGDVPLQVDANASYDLGGARQLARLDSFNLLLIEQPLPPEALRGHAELARRLRTPICLDESVTSAATAFDAVALGACSIVNIKAGRVGGYLEARRVHDVCTAAGVAVWCGGMLETGVGRAANVALAGLPGFTLPGDTSASDRYYARDITAPFELVDGRLEVPDGPGLGVAPLPEVLDEVTTAVSTVRP